MIVPFPMNFWEKKQLNQPIRSNFLMLTAMWMGLEYKREILLKYIRQHFNNFMA